MTFLSVLRLITFELPGKHTSGVGLLKYPNMVFRCSGPNVIDGMNQSEDYFSKRGLNS